MKFSIATLLLGLGAASALDLTPDNWDTATAGMFFAVVGRFGCVSMR
jgi:hypothetical protein